MIEGYTLIIFGDDWEKHPSATQHIIKGLLINNKVIWVNSIGMRAPRLNFDDFKRIFQKTCKAILAKKNIISANLTIINPIALPFHRINLVKFINKFSIRNQIIKTCKLKERKKNILIISNPIATYLSDIIQKDLLIYYCGDDFSKFPGIDKREVLRQEKMLIEHSDIILCSSKNLSNIMKTKKDEGKVYYLPHGVEYAHFSKQYVELPKKIKSIKKPIIGFFGMLGPWIDFDLLKTIAKLDPLINYCIIGEYTKEIEALRGLKNIYLIGKVNYDDLPKYASCFDVGIIPYRSHERIETISPLKLLEYFALGIPVVSTCLPYCVDVNELIYVADNAEKFYYAIKSALNENKQKRLLRKEVAKQNDWKTRCETLSNIIENKMNDQILGHVKK